MMPSQAEFDALILRLQSQKTELAEIEAKEDLPLSSEGDKAFFIHHVAALANNVAPSYLIIGIENNTWRTIGLNSGSPLMDSDQTQSQMNQILEKRLDPQLAIRYRTYDYQGKTLGLVFVEGVRAPYIIAIDYERYGGNRTKGEPRFIYRGAIYVRHGNSTIIANRQSRILEIQYKSSEPGAIAPDDFLAKNNYLDVDSDEYGRNDLTNTLVEMSRNRTSDIPWSRMPAKSLVSYLFIPIDRNCEINTDELARKLRDRDRIAREGKWYHRLPYPISNAFLIGRSTPRSYSAGWFPGESGTQRIYTHIMGIFPTGHAQFAVTYPLFFEGGGYRAYFFVNLVGYLWQLTYLMKGIYQDANYHRNVSILINLIGSSQTYLTDFAEGSGGKWPSINDFTYTPLPQEQAHENSIRIEREVNLTETNDDEIEALIREIAGELGKYYGQDSPKCFTRGTNQFPADYFVRQTSRA